MQLCTTATLSLTARIMGRYGLATRGNVLENTWLGGTADGVLNALMAAYLAISIPPMQVLHMT